MTNHKIGKGFQCIGYICLAGCGLAFLLLPMRTVNSYLESILPRYAQFELLGQVALLILGVFSLLLSRAFGILGNTSYSTEQGPPPKKNISKFSLLLGLAVIVQSIYHIQTPLDVDEYVHANQLAIGNLESEFSPIKTKAEQSTQNHLVAQVSTWLSMKTFGISKISIRLPAILFSTLLILVIWLVGARVYSNFAISLLLLHLNSNQFFIWYAHSMRGYISWVLVVTVCLLICVQGLKNQPNSRSAALFGILFFISCLTHPLGGLFSALLLGAFLVGINQSGIRLKAASKHQITPMLKYAILSLPIFGVLLFYTFVYLSNLGDFNSSTPPAVLSALTELLGLSKSWITRMAILLIVGLSCHQILSQDKKPIYDLSGIFIAVTSLFFLLSIKVLGIRLLEPRFLLVCLVPILLFAGESIAKIKTTNIQVLAKSCAYLIFVVAPAVCGNDVYQSKVAAFQLFDRNVSQIRESLDQEKDNCFSFSGQKDVANWAKNLYFSSTQTVARPSLLCREHYHLHFTNRPGHDSWPLPNDWNLEEVQSFSTGLRVFRLANFPSKKMDIR